MDDDKDSPSDPPQSPNPRKRNHLQFSEDNDQNSSQNPHDVSGLLDPNFWVDFASSSGANTPIPPRAYSPERSEPPSRRRRYPGDGLDFRRPIMSNTVNNPPIIDLTNEDDPPAEPTRQSRQSTTFATTGLETTRQPPRGRTGLPEVIDLEAEDDIDWGSARREESPDLELLYSNPIPRNHHHHHSHWRTHSVPRPMEMDPLREAPRPTLFPPSGLFNRVTAGISGLGSFLPESFLPSPFDRPARVALEDMVEIMRVDMTAQGFRYGLDPGRAARPSPTYEEPPPAREGFTRSAEEGDVVVCPNCDGELGVGDTDEKRQVWVVKGCGHVYCGTCAKYRQKSSRNGKGKQKAVENISSKPFSICVVEDCNQKVSSAKHMFQIFI